MLFYACAHYSDDSNMRRCGWQKHFPCVIWSFVFMHLTVKISSAYFLTSIMYTMIQKYLFFGINAKTFTSSPFSFAVGHCFNTLKCLRVKQPLAFWTPKWDSLYLFSACHFKLLRYIFSSLKNVKGSICYVHCSRRNWFHQDPFSSTSSHPRWLSCYNLLVTSLSNIFQTFIQ